MTWNRRELLGGLGVASAHAMLWAFAGCTAPQRTGPHRDSSEHASDEVRGWLHDAVAQLYGAGFARAHALAVRRTRATAAADVLGANVSRGRADAVVLAIEDARGQREHVTTELSRDGIAAAVRRLVPKSVAPARIAFGPPPRPSPSPRPDLETLADASLLDRVTSIEQRDSSSRIVYAAGLLDVDDAIVWSVSKGQDLEQRLVRVRRSLVRVAWNGNTPSASEVAQAWMGGLDDQTLPDDQIAHVRDTALALMTPGAFPDGEHALVIAPSVVAAIVDATVRALLTTTAARRPEVAQRLAVGANVASPIVTLVDDPTTPNAYGGFRFDDEGEPAAAQTLVDRGRVVGRLADRAGVLAQLSGSAGRGRRAGHSGPVEPMPSHLRVGAAAPSAAAIALVDGYQLEGSRGVMVDPASDRAVIAVSRALELKAGQPTGRVFADVELIGELGALLGTITEASHDTRTYGTRDEVDGLPRWRSIEAPFLRGAGVLRARRARLS